MENAREYEENRKSYRSEYKYIISSRELIILRNRLKATLKTDRNSNELGFYEIHSLYFDTINDKALQEKISGFGVREKFRIRYYNQDTSFIRLEKKCKHFGRTLKYYAKVTPEQVTKIINKDYGFLKLSSDKLFQEFYVKLNSQLLVPKTIVTYRREAYCFNVSKVRITLDSKLRSSVGLLDHFLMPNLAIPSMETHQSILEVKYDHFLPEFIQDIIQLGNIQHTAASKYVACRIYQ